MAKILELKAMDCLCAGYSKAENQKQLRQALADAQLKYRCRRSFDSEHVVHLVLIKAPLAHLLTAPFHPVARPCPIQQAQRSPLHRQQQFHLLDVFRRKQVFDRHRFLSFTSIE